MPKSLLNANINFRVRESSFFASPNVLQFHFLPLSVFMSQRENRFIKKSFWCLREQITMDVVQEILYYFRSTAPSHHTQSSSAAARSPHELSAAKAPRMTEPSKVHSLKCPNASLPPSTKQNKYDLTFPQWDNGFEAKKTGFDLLSQYTLGEGFESFPAPSWARHLHDGITAFLRAVQKIRSNSTHQVPRAVPLLLRKMLHDMSAYFPSLRTQSEQMSHCCVQQACCCSVRMRIRNGSLGRINTALGLALGLLFFFFLKHSWLSF